MSKSAPWKLSPSKFHFGFDKIKFPDGIASSQLYKQAGNSVTVDLIELVATKIKQSIENNKS